MNNPIYVKEILLRIEKELMSIRDFRPCKDWAHFSRRAIDAVLRLQWETISDQWDNNVRSDNSEKSSESEETGIQ